MVTTDRADVTAGGPGGGGDHDGGVRDCQAASEEEHARHREPGGSAHGEGHRLRLQAQGARQGSTRTSSNPPRSPALSLLDL
eukprot:867819-Prorocentrum_minimum.AAC.1